MLWISAWLREKAYQSGDANPIANSNREGSLGEAIPLLPASTAMGQVVRDLANVARRVPLACDAENLSTKKGSRSRSRWIRPCSNHSPACQFPSRDDILALPQREDWGEELNHAAQDGRLELNRSTSPFALLAPAIGWRVLYVSPTDDLQNLLCSPVVASRGFEQLLGSWIDRGMRERGMSP